MSVVIPHHASPELLACTLTALSTQRYAGGHLTVVVADDGSPDDRRPDVSAFPDLDVRVVSHERRGARRAATRNLGVDAADGDVVLFLDADMVPTSDFVAAHARHHLDIDYAVVVGPRIHVDPTDVTPALVRDQITREGSLVPWARTRRHTIPAWRTALLADAARDPGPAARLWRLVAGGNLSIRRAFLNEVGYFDECFEGWGGEDVELGFRLAASGGLVEWEPDAMAVHLGLEATPNAVERAEADAASRLLADRIPDPAFRPDRPVRLWSVPRILVDCAVQPELTFIDRLLDEFPDVRLLVPTEPGGYEAEPRVTTRPSEPAWQRAAIVIELSDVEVDPLAVVNRAREVLDGVHGPGVLLRSSRGEAGRVVWTEAMHRAERSRQDLPPLAMVSLGDPPSASVASVDAELQLALQTVRNVFWGMPGWLRRGLLHVVRSVVGVDRWRR